MTGIAVVASTHDAKFAESVRAALQAAGHDAAASASLPKAAGHYVVLIWSAALEAGHAIDAQALIGLWSEDRLLVARRDATPLPLGLRDLPSLPPGTTAAAICAAVPGAQSDIGSMADLGNSAAQAPSAMKVVGLIIASIIAIVLVGGGAWYYFNKGNIEKQAALTQALENATKASQELQQAQAMQLEALKALDQARAAESEARKSGDMAKLLEAQGMVKRAEAEAAKQAEAVKQREAAASDSRKKAQEAGKDAKSAKAEPKQEATAAPKQEVAVAAPVAEAPKVEAPVAESAPVARPMTRSQREQMADEEAARKALAAAGRTPAAAPQAPVQVASTVPSEPASADPQAKAASDHDSLYQQAAAMEQEGKAAESIRIYRRAARAGSGKAAKRLGEIYDKGIPGVSRDYAESLQWYETARQLGEQIETAGRRGGPEAPVAAAPASAPVPSPSAPIIPEAAKPVPEKLAVAKSARAVREPPKAAPVPVAKPAPAPEPVKAAEPAPVPAPAPAPEPPKAAAPVPTAAPVPEAKPGWFSMRGLLIALLVLGLIAWRRARRREKALARQSQPQSVAAIDSSPARATVLIATLSESVKLGPAAVDECLRAVRECTEAAKGRVVRTRGDEVVASFPGTDAAADAAIEIQIAIDALKPVDGQKAGLRIGVCHGPISIEADGNIYGEAVNVASRLSQVAVKGQILAARDTVMQMSPMLKSATRKITTIQVKGRAAEVEVYELMWQQSEDAATMAAARSVYKPRVDAPQGDAALFVSYSHKDRPRVEPIVSVIEEMGRRVWMDRNDITGQTGWAGQIVRAIRECRAVVLMASPNSYSSDQVVRELYLAMNHRKTIVPIEIEPADMPDELQYILAPFQHHRLSGGETRAVLGRALAAV